MWHDLDMAHGVHIVAERRVVVDENAVWLLRVACDTGPPRAVVARAGHQQNRVTNSAEQGLATLVAMWASESGWDQPKNSPTVGFQNATTSLASSWSDPVSTAIESCVR